MFWSTNLSSHFHLPQPFFNNWQLNVTKLQLCHYGFKRSIYFLKKKKMSCLANRPVGLLILQALHWTAEKYLTHPCHPVTLVTLQSKRRKFQGKKGRKFGMLWASMQWRQKSNPLPLHLFPKLKSKIIHL